MGVWGALAGSLLAECSGLELLESLLSSSGLSPPALGPCPLAVTPARSLGEVERAAPLPSQEPCLWLSLLLLLPLLVPWKP